MTKERAPTNIRGLLIMETISQSSHAMTPTEINVALGLPKQSIHRLCAALVKMGFLIYDESGKRLRPSRRSRQIANGLLQTDHMHIMRRKILERVAGLVQETVNFVLPEENGMTYQDRVETDWPFRINLPVGANVPFHCTASGKVFLSSLSAQSRRKMVQALDLKAQTKNTITDADEFLDELRRVRAQGFALDSEEFMDGMVAVAVPVYDDRGKFAAVLACHGPIGRLDIHDPKLRDDALIPGAKALKKVMFSHDNYDSDDSGNND